MATSKTFEELVGSELFGRLKDSGIRDIETWAGIPNASFGGDSPYAAYVAGSDKARDIMEGLCSKTG